MKRVDTFTIVEVILLDKTTGSHVQTERVVITAVDEDIYITMSFALCLVTSQS